MANKSAEIHKAVMDMRGSLDKAEAILTRMKKAGRIAGERIDHSRRILEDSNVISAEH